MKPGVPAIPGDDDRVRKFAAELQAQQGTKGAPGLVLEGYTAGAVLNVLVGRVPPPGHGVEIGERVPVKEHSFMCPNCGAHWFGTSREPDAKSSADWIVNCHGSERSGACGWSGPYREHVRNDDD